MPYEGEIRRGYEIGVESKTEKSRKYIWVVCKRCKQSRWMQQREVIKSRFSGLCRKCLAHRVGKEHPNWKGGKKHSSGYILIKRPGHPRAEKTGYVKEHIIVWEQFHGKPLPDGWRIHHLNGIKHDNRPTNLLAMPTKRHDNFIPLLQKRIRELEALLNQQGLLL